MQTTSVSSDVSGLDRLIDLPKSVFRVRWERIRKHGDSSLSAVVWLSGPDLQKLVLDSPKLDVQSPIRIDPALIGNDTTQGHRSDQWQGVNIEPRAFVNPKKSGLLNGRATVVAESGFVYIALYEM